MDPVRPDRDRDAVRPGRRRPDRDERVHRGAAVPSGPPGRAVEAAAGPGLDDRRGHEDEAVDRLHRDRGLRPEHQGHDPEGDRRSRRRPRRAAGRAAAARSRSSASNGGAQRPPGGGLLRGRRRLQLVAGGLDRPGQLGPAGRRRAGSGSSPISVARLTDAVSTPSLLRRNRSIRLTHEAQVMPAIGRSISTAGDAGDSILPGSISQCRSGFGPRSPGTADLSWRRPPTVRRDRRTRSRRFAGELPRPDDRGGMPFAEASSSSSGDRTPSLTSWRASE